MPYSSVFRPDLFRGQTVIVTGGGSGIGRCTAHELASLGAHLVLVGRTPEKLAAVRGEIVEDGGTADTEAFDIRDEAAVEAGIEAIVARNGRIHGLVNNAGGQFAAPLEKISLKGWDAVVRNNLNGGFLVSREVYLRSMQTDGGGAIVNIVADMWRSMVGMAHSGAARAGMMSLTETAAVEWAHANVRVNAVAPGWVMSSGFDTYPVHVQQHLSSLAPHVPLQRLGREAEVSAAICFLLSPAAAFITGSCIRADGGVPNAPVEKPLKRSAGNAHYDGFHREVLPRAITGGG